MFTEKSLVLHDIFQNLIHTQVHSKNQILYTTQSLYQIAIFMYMFKNRLLPLVYSNNLLFLLSSAKFINIIDLLQNSLIISLELELAMANLM